MIRKNVVTILLLLLVSMTKIVYSLQSVKEAAILARRIVKDAGRYTDILLLFFLLLIPFPLSPTPLFFPFLFLYRLLS